MPSGGAVATLSIATSETWRDKTTGEQKEKTEWHRVTVFGKLAEIARDFLKKGSQVYVEGELRTKKWQDQSGENRYTTSVVVQGYKGILQMLGNRQLESNSPQTQTPLEPPQYNEPPMDFDDDIPF